MVWFAVLHALSFAIGSIPIGYLLSRFRGVDIRHHGSGNTGATNVARTLGKRAGAFTLVGDLLKGIAGTHLALLLPQAQHLSRPEFVELAASLGFFAVAGHCFSPFLKGRGGKGVATGLGVFLSLAPLETLFCCVLFVATVLITRYVSLGSIASAVAMTPIILLRLQVRGEHAPMLVLVSTMTAILIVLRHRENVRRIFSRTETKLGKGADPLGNTEALEGR